MSPEQSSIGPWRIGSLIGEGRTSTVHAAWERVTGRPVALKIARNEGHEGALLAEYAVAGALEFAELVAPHALGRLPDGRLAVAMERVEGGPVDQGDFDEDERLEIALGICRALAVLHGRGGYHGDLSPDNVLVERRAAGPRARLIDATPDRRIRVGTPGFIAPEVLQGQSPGPAADRYALGCLLHLVLTGRPVFDVPPERLVDHHLRSTPELHPDLDPELAEALAVLLVKAPADRAPGLQSIVSLLAELLDRDPDLERTAVARAIIGGDRVIGRADARRAVNGALDGLDAGWGDLVWITGPAGSGRSALARWIVAEAARRGHLASRISGAGDPIAGCLAALGIAAPDDEAVTAVTRAWVDAAESAPRCVVVDVHEPDPLALRRAGQALASASRMGPVAVFVLAPDGATCPGVEPRPIAPLTGAERQGIVLDRLGDDCPAARAVAEALDAPALQQPGALITVLRGLIDGRTLVWGDGGWTLDRERLAADVPTLIDGARDGALDGAVLASMSPAGRLALAVLGMARRPLDEQGLLDRGGMEVLAGLSALEDAELITTTEAGLAPRRWSLARAAWAGLAAERRARVHRLTAATQDAASRLGAARRDRHLFLAGEPLSARQRADAARALVEAGFSRAALDLLGMEGVDGDDRIALAIARARVHAAQGLIDDALAELDAAPANADVERARIRLLARAGRHAEVIAAIDPDTAATSTRMWLSRSLVWSGEFEQAEAVARSVIDETNADDDALSGAFHVRATVAWQTGRLEAAEAMARDALEAAEGGPVRADLLRTLGGVRIYRGDLAGAAEPLEQAVALDRRLGRTPELAKSLNNLGVLRYQRGDLAGARSAFEEYALLAGRVGDPVELSNVNNNLGQLALRLGEPVRAAALCRRALRIAEGANYERMLPVARSNLGAALTRSGQLDEAAEALERASAELEAVDGRHDLIELRRRQIELAIAAGDRSRAQGIGAALLDDPNLEGVPIEAGQVRRLMADLAIARGDMDAARGLAEDAIARLEALDCHHELAIARETRARVMYATGRFETAIMEVRRALQTHRALGARADADRAGHLLDEAEERYRRSDQSVRHAQVLLELSLAIGSTMEPHRLLEVALDGIIETLEVERGLIALYDGDALGDVVTRHLQWEDDSPLPVSESILAEARVTGRPVVIQDAVEEGVVWTRTSVALLGLRSIVCLPIRRRKETLGVIYVDSRRLVATDLDAEVELLTGVARMLGVALHNARLYTRRLAEQAQMSALLAEARAALAGGGVASDLVARIDAHLSRD